MVGWGWGMKQQSGSCAGWLKGGWCLSLLSAATWLSTGMQKHNCAVLNNAALCRAVLCHAMPCPFPCRLSMMEWTSSAVLVSRPVATHYQLRPLGTALPLASVSLHSLPPNCFPATHCPWQCTTASTTPPQPTMAQEHFHRTSIPINNHHNCIVKTGRHSSRCRQSLSKLTQAPYTCACLVSQVPTTISITATGWGLPQQSRHRTWRGTSPSLNRASRRC